jgi:hypothetical protein
MFCFRSSENFEYPPPLIRLLAPQARELKSNSELNLLVACRGLKRALTGVWANLGDVSLDAPMATSRYKPLILR